MVSGGRMTDMLFYDGHCGLCHRAVKFVLRRDHAGLFHFAPLQGETFQNRGRLFVGDTMVVERDDGVLLTRSDAWLYILQRLGGQWNTLAWIAARVPRRVRDEVYDLIARTRHRIFTRTDAVCPIVPPEWRNRFHN